MRFIILSLAIAFSMLSADTQRAAFDISKGFSGVVDKLLPAVVSVQATQVLDRQENGVMAIPGMPSGRTGNPLEELFREFMGQMERPRKLQAVGAGFIIQCDGKIAYVVTNHHVVSEAKTLTVVLEDKTEISATLLASDERNDVAVIKLDLSTLPQEKRNLPTVEWANSDEVKTGDWVIAIGNPFNFGGTVTVGVVSHKGRYVPSGMQQDFEFIQHSAQINVGSSGGALFDAGGKVIGINNAIITNTGGNIGIGFAIPANVARQTVDQLIKYGKTRRGHLGIRIQALNEDMAESQGLKETGVIVGSIIDGGPSDGKLKSGDIILEFEGKKVTESYILSRMIAETEIGKTVKLKVWREGKFIEVTIKVEEMPDIKKEEGKNKTSGRPGIATVAGLEVSKIPEEIREQLKELNKESHGVIILGIDPNSPAGDQGLLIKGDIIEEANHKALNSPADFEAIVKQAKKEKRKNILLLISRDGKPAYLPLRIEEDTPTKPADKEPIITDKLTPNSADAKNKNATEGNEKSEKKQENKNIIAERIHESSPQQSVEQEPEEEPLEAQEYEQEAENVVKDRTNEDFLAKSDQNTLKDSQGESVTSKIVQKLRSMFGKG